MISVFVNLFAAMAYWAKLASHMNGDVGPAANVVTYKYLDYMATCPLLTADLLWALNLPYKFTYAGFVLVCIMCAFMATTCPAPAKFMWFGMGFSLFMYVWYQILTLVKMRLDQMVSKSVKKVRFYLKVACTTYFAIWIGYPTLWVLFEAGVIDPVTSHLMHVLFDVIAKSVYGFALLFFVVGGEKHDFVFLELRPTVEREPESDEDDDGKGEDHIVIGSKKAKQIAKSKTRPSATSDDGFNSYSTNFQGNMFNATQQGQSSGDINNTAAEIMQLNAQLEHIMAKEKSLEQQTRRDDKV